MTAVAYKKRLGQRIADARERAGLTQTDLAQLCGLLDANRVSRYERGRATPSLPQAAALASALSVSLEWLATGEQHVPAAYYEWLQTPVGGAASPEAREFLRQLPLAGYAPTVVWYSLAFQAFEHGLSPVETLRAATTTERYLSD